MKTQRTKKAPPLCGETGERGLGGEFSVALYIRVSTERQANEGDSLEEQESELKKYCDFRKFAIHQIYIERGKSGGNTNRPEYQKLIKDIQGRKIKAVVVKKLDRLSRSLLDFENLMRLMNENDVEFISIKENFDTTTAMGKAMLRVALVFAQLEREQTLERLSDVMNYRATQGLFNGGFRPFGYVIVEKELVPYQKEKQVVEVIFKRFIETHSTTNVKQYLEENGLKYLEGRTWDIRQIQRILQNSVYIGKIKWAGQENEGVHAPLITESTFARAQKIFSESEFTKSRGKTHAMFAKKLFCSHCGSPMAPSHSVNRYKTKYYYYRCTGSKNKHKNCGQKHFSFEKLDGRLFQILLSLSEEQHFRPIENKLLKHNEQVMTQITEQEKSSLHLDSVLNQLKIKKDKYLDTLLSSQFLSKERELINTKINEMEAEEKQLKTAILKQQFNVTQAKEELINISEIKKQFIGYRSSYPFASSHEHRTQLSNLIEKIVCDKDSLDIQFIAIPWKEHFNLAQ